MGAIHRKPAMEPAPDMDARNALFQRVSYPAAHIWDLGRLTKYTAQTMLRQDKPAIHPRD